MKVLLLENKNFSDFNPIDFGYEKCTPLHSFGPYIRKAYLIHYVSKGSGIFRNERGEYAVTSGQAFLIRPGEICYYEAAKQNPWEYTWLNFNGRLAKKFNNFDDVINIDSTIFEEMRLAFKSLNPEEFLAGMLFRLYSELNVNTAAPDYASRVMSYINVNYMNSISVEKIADILKLNRKYLSRIFKEKTGITIQEYLISKRLSEAKKLLKNGYGVGESAYMVGYADAFNFSKAFKKHFGTAPKNSIRQNCSPESISAADCSTAEKIK